LKYEINIMNAKVDAYISKAKNWQQELELLRKIILECGLTEEFKWRNPCYTSENSNVIIIGGFKEYCGLMFFKGVLLNDAEGILIQQTENVQSARQIRFTSVGQIVKNKPIIKAYIYEAIEVEKAGLKVELKKNTELILPEEFTQILSKNAALKKAFNALTPGRQKGYNLYFSAAKQSSTRVQRIEKHTQQILNGKGLLDCTCGLSKKMPNCDGSHKYLKTTK
jgi:uncharacterized protein YdeI (YjbR/CyaY-like superfamily)